MIKFVDYSGSEDENRYKINRQIINETKIVKIMCYFSNRYGIIKVIS